MFIFSFIDVVGALFLSLLERNGNLGLLLRLLNSLNQQQSRSSTRKSKSFERRDRERVIKDYQHQNWDVDDDQGKYYETN